MRNEALIKQRLRRDMLKAALQCPGPDPEAVASRICDMDEYRSADLVLAYIALGSEVDVGGVIDRAIKDGKTVAVPDLEPGAFRIVQAPWRGNLIQLGNKTSTVDNTSGILNFRLTDSIISFNKGIILVPGLAFTEFGTRLGRGAGYYDQVLKLAEQSEMADLTSIGVCKKTQLVHELPQQPHDRKVHVVITF